MSQTFPVRFEGLGVDLQAAPGTDLLTLCEEHDLPMGSDCGGFAACAACRVSVIGAETGLSPCVEEEEAFLDAPGQRLGCQAKVCGPVTVRLDPGMDC